MKSNLSASSSPVLTCLSIDCPERFSLCCHARCTREKDEFICSKCKKPFEGGKCNAGENDEPIMMCPVCHEIYPDKDGFGVLFCPKCLHCTHPSVTGGVCDLCHVRRDNFEEEWWWKGWEIFKRRAFGRHPDLWNLSKEETIRFLEKEFIPKLLSLQKRDIVEECAKEFHVGRLKFMKRLFLLHGKQFEDGWRTARNFLTKQKGEYLRKNNLDF